MCSSSINLYYTSAAGPMRSITPRRTSSPTSRCCPIKFFGQVCLGRKLRTALPAMTLFSFLPRRHGGKALDLAYADGSMTRFLPTSTARRAVPFIIAGLMGWGARRLEQHRIWMLRFIGANVWWRLFRIGFSFDGSNGVPVCEYGSRRAALFSIWNTMAQGAPCDADWIPSNDICVNPITWRTDGHALTSQTTLAALGIRTAPRWKRFCRRRPVGLSSRSLGGYAQPRTTVTRMFGKGNYHVYDYSLFHRHTARTTSTARVSYMSSISIQRRAKKRNDESERRGLCVQGTWRRPQRAWRPGRRACVVQSL